MSDEPTASDDALAPGAALPEGHSVEELLAVGRIGTAYVVRGPAGERRAAHVLHADRVDALREWFVKSAWLRESLDHPHLPRTYAVGATDDARPAEVTELLEGETLREALANRSAPIPLGVVARVLRELAAALDHLHARATPVVHRALTPECVLLTAPDGVVKLLGVGDAERPEADPVRAAYQSPEALAEVTVTPRADVFVLASLAFEMLTGKPAFPGTRDEVLTRLRSAQRPSAAAARRELPKAVDETLHACWALAADERPACAMEFALAFGTALGTDDTSEHPVTHDTESGSVPLQVMRRRSALLGPTQEMPATSATSARSFLHAVERTEVSVAAAADRPAPAPMPTPTPTPAPAPARPAAPLRSARSTLREDAPARGLAVGPPTRSDADPTTRIPFMVPKAPVPKPSPQPPVTTKEAAPPQSPKAPSPFAHDLRATLHNQQPGGDDAGELTPRLDAVPTAPTHATNTPNAPSTPSATAAASPTPTPAAVPVPVSKPTPLSPPTRPTEQRTAQPTPMPTATSASKAPTSADPAPSAGAAPPSDAPLADLFAPLPDPPATPAAAVSDARKIASAALPDDATPALPAATPTATAPDPARPTAPRASAGDSDGTPVQRPRRNSRSPDDHAFPDEPTGTITIGPDRPPESPWRSPLVIASIFLANAILIVGIAQAIAQVAQREPAVRVVPGPAPACAPCAPCAACPTGPATSAPPPAANAPARHDARPASRPVPPPF